MATWAIDPTAVGVGAAFVGNAVIGFSQSLQKYAINRLQHSHKPRWHDPLWITGILSNILGEVFGNFVALSYASASIVAPLGAISLVVNGILAAKLLGENISRRHQMGYLYLILGVLVLVTIAPKASSALTVVELVEHMQTKGFLLYFSALMMIGSFLMMQFVRRKLRTPNAYVLLAAILGSFSVISSKALSVLLRLTLVDGDSQFTSAWPFVFMATLALSTITLEVVKQAAITIYNASCFWPLFFAGYNLLGISLSLVLSQELEGSLLRYIAGFILGLLLVWNGATYIGGASLGPVPPLELGKLEYHGATSSATTVESLSPGGTGAPALTRWLLTIVVDGGRVAKDVVFSWRDRWLLSRQTGKVAES